MGEAKRKTYAAAFKAKIGLEAIRGVKTVGLTCCVPWDYIPKRSYPLFQAREALRTLRDEMRVTKRPQSTTPSSI